MGLTNLKGNTAYFRSIGQNLMITASKFKYENGRFGENSGSTGKRTREIVSSNPLETATEFYNLIANGGKEDRLKNGKGKITFMADGTIITFRETSTTTGKPTVEINIKKSKHTGGIKDQKIHFNGEKNEGL